MTRTYDLRDLVAGLSTVPAVPGRRMTHSDDTNPLFFLSYRGRSAACTGLGD